MLLELYDLQGVRLRNRICIPPMVVWAATEEGLVTDYILDHYRSLQGAGLTIVEATAVAPEGRLARRQIGAFREEHLPGLTALAEAIAASGSVPGIQIHHAGRQTSKENTFGLELVAPSSITTGKDMPMALDKEGINALLQSFAEAADRVVRAGFRVVEIHGAHGYLISQFLSPAANHRTDIYGGELENRARFALEALALVRKAVGKRALLSMRLGVVDSAPGGLTLAEGIQVARWLETLGIDLLHVSSGIGGIPEGVKPESSPYSPLLHLAQSVKRHVKIPVIGVGGIRTPEQAEQALADNMADLIAVGKAHLADPKWSLKAQTEPETISPCHGCRPCGHFRQPYKCPAREAK